MAKKKRGQHVMSHQTGYRVVTHDLKTGKHVRSSPWTVVGAYAPVLINHEEDPAHEATETPEQEAAEHKQGG